MDEFQKKHIKEMMTFVAGIKISKPYTKSRNSNQTWLETDRNSVKTLQSLRQRCEFKYCNCIQSEFQVSRSTLDRHSFC